MTPPPARSRKQRKQDTLDRLEHDEDVWVATADPGGGVPYLVPLSFHWDGSALLPATPATSPTGRNLNATGRTRLGIGPTRDVARVDSPRPTCTSVSGRSGCRRGARPMSWRGGS